MLAVDSNSLYWGGCPICHAREGIANVGKGHWAYCTAHRVKWFIGSNLFSSWKDETEEEQRERYGALELGRFERVEPHYEPVLAEAEGS